MGIKWYHQWLASVCSSLHNSEDGNTVPCKLKPRILCVFLFNEQEKKEASVLGFAFQPSGYKKPSFEILLVSHVPHCEDKTVSQNMLRFRQQKSNPLARSHELTGDKYHSHPIGAKKWETERSRQPEVMQWVSGRAKVRAHSFDSQSVSEPHSQFTCIWPPGK